MKLERKMLTLYAVTDRSWLGNDTLYQQVEKALMGGVTMVQLREKNLSREEFEEEAKKLLPLCRAYKAPLIINDDVELAKKTDADGVHIGQSDMQIQEAREILGCDKIIGVTAKTVAQAKEAEAAGADYLGSGAVFGSSTKKDAIPMEHSLLQEICKSVKIPVVAIGGITAENAMQLKGRGMDGIAVVSGIFASSDIKQAAQTLRAIAEETLIFPCNYEGTE